MAIPAGTGSLPPGSSVLAVCAHPDDESFGLGAILHRFAAAGVRTSVLCFTHGEASTLGPFASGLREIREAELSAAARQLGVGSVEVLDHPDGALAAVPLDVLVDAVRRSMAIEDADLLLVFDAGGVTGHLDHCRATEAAVAAAANDGVPVLAWGVPKAVSESLNEEFSSSFVGREQFDVVLTVDRDAQRRAIACHASQSTHNPVLWRRLELLGGTESLRWLRPSPLDGFEIDVPAAVTAGTTAKEA
jgi:LmbE family N-acetylglucosaminyl deacetylase